MHFRDRKRVYFDWNYAEYYSLWSNGYVSIGSGNDLVEYATNQYRIIGCVRCFTEYH